MPPAPHLRTPAQDASNHVTCAPTSVTAAPSHPQVAARVSCGVRRPAAVSPCRALPPSAQVNGAVHDGFVNEQFASVLAAALARNPSEMSTLNEAAKSMEEHECVLPFSVTRSPHAHVVMVVTRG